MSDSTPPPKVTPISAIAADPRHLRDETFSLTTEPTPREIINLMGRMAKALNTVIAEALRSGQHSCANPAIQGMSNASSCLEQGSIQFFALMQQQQAGQFAGPGAGGPPPAQGGPGPFRMN